MNKLGILFVLLVSAKAFAAAGLPQPADVKAKLNQGGIENYRSAQLGTQMVDKKVQLMKASYSFARDGGAQSTLIALKDVDGKDAVIPAGAVISNVLIDTITTPTGPTGTQISLQMVGNDDLAASTLVTSFTGVRAGTPIGTAATSFKLAGAAASTVYLDVGASTLTAGKFNVFIEYFLSDLE